MDSNEANSSPSTRNVPIGFLGPDLLVETKKKVGGYQVAKTDNLWNKAGKQLKVSDREALTCSSCCFILREPYQVVSCGHRYCHSCIEEIMQSSDSRCVDDQEPIVRSDVHKDRGCTKEIAVLVVECPGREHGCNWKDLLILLESHLSDCQFVLHDCKYGCGVQLMKEYLSYHEENECVRRLVSCSLCGIRVMYMKLEIHLQSCEYVPVTCDSCKEEVPKAKMEEHVNFQCPKKTAQCSISGCGYTATLLTLNQHISEKHSLHLLHIINSLQAQLQERDAVIKTQGVKLAELEASIQKIAKRSIHYDTADPHSGLEYAKQGSSHLTPLDSGFESYATSHHSDIEFSGARDLPPRIHRLEVSVAELKPAIEQLEHNVSSQASQLAGYVEALQSVQETATRHAVSMEEIKLRQDILDVKTTTGVFVWKIPDIKKRFSDAVDRRTLSLYSPPFHTSPHGYRICIRAYLNGDGSGKGTHISVFFVLMRSEQDNLLRWPFAQPVTFILVNQNAHPSASISETFLPDARSPSFQQPRSEMNVASGFPRFAPQSILRDESFTKGNAIYIKCRVDTKGISAD